MTEQPTDRSDEVCEAICALLHEQQAPFEIRDHPPVRTAEQAAQYRGESMQIGGKSLVIKVRDRFRLFVLSAVLKLDSRAIQARFETSYTRFATAEELFRLTSLQPGSVPPFGEPILPLPLYLDDSILENDRLAFTPGLRTRSVLMASADYVRIANPVEIFPFAARPL